jgi:hypothetical protein
MVSASTQRCFATLILRSTKAYDDPDASSWSVCNTAFLYENDRDSSPETNVNCGPSSYNWSYYRSEPTDAKTTSSMYQLSRSFETVG